MKNLTIIICSLFSLSLFAESITFSNLYDEEYYSETQLISDYNEFSGRQLTRLSNSQVKTILENSLACEVAFSSTGRLFSHYEQSSLFHLVCDHDDQKFFAFKINPLLRNKPAIEEFILNHLKEGHGFSLKNIERTYGDTIFQIIKKKQKSFNLNNFYDEKFYENHEEATFFSENYDTNLVRLNNKQLGKILRESRTCEISYTYGDFPTYHLLEDSSYFGFICDTEKEKHFTIKLNPYRDNNFFNESILLAFLSKNYGYQLTSFSQGSHSYTMSIAR